MSDDPNNPNNTSDSKPLDIPGSPLQSDDSQDDMDTLPDEALDIAVHSAIRHRREDFSERRENRDDGS